MESETPVMAPQVHAEFRCEMEEEVVGLRFETFFRGDRLVKRVASNQVGVPDRGREDSRDGVGEELRKLIRDRDGDALRFRASLEGVEHPSLAKRPRPGVRGFEEDLLEAHFLRADECRRFPEERILREAREAHALGTSRGHKSPWRGNAKRAVRPPACRITAADPSLSGAPGGGGMTPSCCLRPPACPRPPGSPPPP